MFELSYIINIQIVSILWSSLVIFVFHHVQLLYLEYTYRIQQCVPNNIVTTITLSLVFVVILMMQHIYNNIAGNNGSFLSQDN